MSANTGMVSHPQSSTPLLNHNRGYMTPYKKVPWYKRKYFYFNLIRRSLAEFFATGLYVFVAVSALSSASYDAKYGARDPRTSTAMVAALAHGFAYSAMMAATVHVSGGHLNPAVTLGVFVAGGINVVAVICYFIAQISGGIVGAACVLAYDVTSGSSKSNYSVINFGVSKLGDDYHPIQGILTELLLSVMFVTVFIHTTMEPRRAADKDKEPTTASLAPVYAGFALAAAVLASYSITGGSLNPARSIGPSIFGSVQDRWKTHYIYWVGPLLGGVVSGVFYRLILSSSPLIPLTDKEEGSSPMYSTRRM